MPVAQTDIPNSKITSIFTALILLIVEKLANRRD